MPNELIKEKSPYLLQHAFNPVNWYAWNSHSLELAKKQDKIILVSIGYSACHWCHVMEKECFENSGIAAIMNEHFINIKIDREERPDLDQIYMDAVQSMTGQGGWPLNVFLTPDKKPFFGGTYFPPESRGRYPAWPDILKRISFLWNNDRQNILTQAENVYNHVKTSSELIITTPEHPEFSNEDFETVFENILKAADKVYGGFGRAPKFLQTFTINFLQAYSKFKKNEEAGKQWQLSLKKMLDGGIYDQIGGGIARYSTDENWLIPHFEKMLYDNALLLISLAEGFKITGNNYYKVEIENTVKFLLREMKSAEGGFYSAIDADSEGEEGKFYLWQKSEIDKILKTDSEMFCRLYGVSEHGNWQGKNILSKMYQFDDANINRELIEECCSKLLLERNKRVRPATDDKIMMNWNSLLISAFCKAYEATNLEVYKNEAIDLCDFINSNFQDKNGNFYHLFKDGLSEVGAFLDDYSYYISACINVYEITADERFLQTAKSLTGKVINTFSSENGLFYFTSAGQEDNIVRQIEYYDGALPSANATMIKSLNYLSVCYDLPGWQKIAQSNLIMLKEMILKYPASFGTWAMTAFLQLIGIKEIHISGGAFNNMLANVLKIYLPNKIFLHNIGERNLNFSFDKTRKEAVIHICENNHCTPPLKSFEELERHLNVI